MFFGGGFPGGPGVRFRTHRGGAYYRANRAYQESRRQSGPGRGSTRGAARSGRRTRMICSETCFSSCR